MKILIVEDDVNLALTLKNMLSDIAEITVANSCEEALDGGFLEQADLVILDLMLPRMSGLELLKTVRKTSSIPIIILSAIGETNKKVECLNAGADDYMSKPFSRDELLARVNAMLRRFNKSFLSLRYSFKELVIDFPSKMVTVNGEMLAINGKMYDLFETLVRNKDIIVTKQQIYQRVWGVYSEALETIIGVYISNLRKLLFPYGLSENLYTIKNSGYMWKE